ncbi:hypothetical protein JTE90_012246 [Oedothorax gibbosus]|uniref:Uncharacterized protein n=1 Tax=Oedothorax gibbosus TaxID=931172 RepID=A0AAV6TCN9_9ARAC|nr:hypothetical protein JTE90_012246 [Oedothorax gibbosus]
MADNCKSPTQHERGQRVTISLFGKEAHDDSFHGGTRVAKGHPRALQTGGHAYALPSAAKRASPAKKKRRTRNDPSVD